MAPGSLFVLWIVVYSIIHAVHVYRQHRIDHETTDEATAAAVIGGVEYAAAIYLTCIVLLVVIVLIAYYAGWSS